MADYFTGTWRLVVSIVWDAYKGDQTPPGRVRQLEEGVERLISDQQALVDIVPLALKAGHEIDFKSLDDNLDEKALYVHTPTQLLVPCLIGIQDQSTSADCQGTCGINV